MPGLPHLRPLARLAVAAALLFAPASARPEAPAGPLSLEALMAGMAKAPGVSARFVETKEVALLSAPIETRGTILFAPPDRLLRTTEPPSASRLAIAGERFAFRDEAGGEAVDLSANPLAREFVDSFIVLFGGDLARLRERYEPELTSEGEAWRLALRPRQRPLSDLVERITLSGAGARLREMELLEKDGDRTTTRFSDVAVDRPIPPEEVERWFDSGQ